MVDYVTRARGRRLAEVPVGFMVRRGLDRRQLRLRWRGERGGIVPPQGRARVDDRQGWSAPRSAGGRDAREDREATPGAHYRTLEAAHGVSHYTRIDAPATSAQKKRLSSVDGSALTATSIAGEEITGRLTTSPEGKAPFGGIKVETKSGWFAARPSGTEEIYKVYAESFAGEDHLKSLVAEARAMVDRAIG